MNTQKMLVIAGERMETPLCCLGSETDLVFDLTGAPAGVSLEQIDGRWNLVQQLDSNAQFQLRKRTCLKNGVYQHEDLWTVQTEAEQVTTTFDDTFPGGVVDQSKWRFGEYWNTKPDGTVRNDIEINPWLREIQRYTFSGDMGHEKNPAGAPLGYNPFSAANGGNGLKITATKTPSGLIANTYDPAKVGDFPRTYLSGQIVQKHDPLAQQYGIFEQCVKLPFNAGMFPGGWVNGRYVPFEADLFEGSFKFRDRVHQNFHQWKLAIAKAAYSAASSPNNANDNFGMWKFVCPNIDTRFTCFRFHYRPTDRTDSDGCRIAEGIFTIDGVVSHVEDSKHNEPIHHVVNLAVADGRNQFVDGPPVDDSFAMEIKRIRTLQYNSILGWDKPYIAVRPTLTGPNNFMLNMQTGFANVGDQLTLGAGNVPGLSLVYRKLRIGGFDGGPVSPGQITGPASALEQSVYAHERWFDSVTGFCTDTYSDAIYLG